MPVILNISKWECRAVQGVILQHNRYMCDPRAITVGCS
jgi:hypothetical protein